MSEQSQDNDADIQESRDKPCRRVFLKTGGAAVAVIAFGVGCSRQVNQGTFPAGESAGIAAGSARVVEDGPFVIARDEGGLYAMSARCTHMGCTVGVEGGQLPCPCHGAVFDMNGQVVEGPARTPLDHFQVTVEGGTVSVDTTQVVPAETRAPLEG